MNSEPSTAQPDIPQNGASAIALRIQRYFPSILALLPPLILFITVARYHVNVPFSDQWTGMLPLLVKKEAGLLTMGDFWQQHNEHRLLISRPLLLILASIGGWNVSLEILTNLLLASLTFLLWRKYVFQLGSEHSLPGAGWITVCVSFLSFSFQQCENWLLGWQFHMFLNVFAVITGAILLSRPITLKRFVILWILNLLALFSFASGILFGPLVFAGMCLHGHFENIRKRTVLLVWAISWILFIFLYFHQLELGSTSSGSLLDLTRLPNLFLYLFTFLGSMFQPLRQAEFLRESSSMLPAIAGFSGLLMFLGILIQIYRSGRWNSRLLPLLLLPFHAIVSGLLAGVGRMDGGVEQALSSRYTTIANLFWISLLVLLWIWISPRLVQRKWKVSLIPLMILFIACMSFMSFNMMPAVRGFYYQLKQGQLELYFLKNDDHLRKIFPNADVVRKMAPVLREFGWVCFAQQPENPDPVEFWREVVQSHPKDFQAHVLLAQALYYDGQWAESKKEMNIANALRK